MSIDATCPACESPIEGFRAVDCERSPRAGAWAICEHCAEVLRFTPGPNGGLTLRRSTLVERSGPEAPAGLDDALRVVLAQLPARH